MNLRSGSRFLHNAAARALLKPLLKYEWRREAKQGLTTARLTEYAVAMRWLAERYPRTMLDVGPGPGSWPHLAARTGIAVTAIDSMESPERGRFLNRQWFFNRHYHVIRDDITQPRLTGQFDCVTCISILELIPDHRAAMRGMFSFLKPGGFLILSCPYNEHQFIENAYALRDSGYGDTYPFICRQYSRTEVDIWLSENGGTLVERELYRCFTGEFWTVGDRVIPPTHATADEPHHMTCMCIQKD